MKKMWKFRKDSRAVSPVIATILMVAITVVLAAVLYVMVMGFGGSGTVAPIAGFNAPEKTATNTYKISISSIDKTTQWSDCKVFLANNTAGTSATSVALSNDYTATLNAATVTVTDLGGDNTIGAGDYFIVSGTTSTQSYTISLLWGGDNDQIATITWTAT